VLDCSALQYQEVCKVQHHPMAFLTLPLPSATLLSRHDMHTYVLSCQGCIIVVEGTHLAHWWTLQLMLLDIPYFRYHHWLSTLETFWQIRDALWWFRYLDGVGLQMLGSQFLGMCIHYLRINRTLHISITLQSTNKVPLINGGTSPFFVWRISGPIFVFSL
jgi:hypothetical protein